MNASRGSGLAGDVVKRYLESLARGDADTALSYAVDQPASKEFLTSHIRKKQVAQWPISNIRILAQQFDGACRGAEHGSRACGRRLW